MGNPLTPIDGSGTPANLIGEAIRIFSILSPREQRSLLSRFSQITGNSIDEPKDIGRAADSRIDRLTDREKQVLVLLSNGYTRREIGDSLNISANTSARHIANIYRKLDISTSAEAVRKALEAGLTR